MNLLPKLHGMSSWHPKPERQMTRLLNSRLLGRRPVTRGGAIDVHALGIVLMCVVAAVCYGVVHDQVTARVCVEYFTVGHPPVFGTDDPTLLGIGWGIIATWWVGLLLGVPLAIFARVGSRPKRSFGSLVRPIAGLLGVMAVFALAAGVMGWFLARSGAVFLVGPIARALPADRHVPFLADLWAHSASYLVGLVGGIVVMIRVWRSRRGAVAVQDAEQRGAADAGTEAPFVSEPSSSPVRRSF
jgi:hypothetical protein